MYQTACPACGAPVSFRSAASVMAVCSYCQSTLIRDADSVRDIGKMSAVLEDWSRIQIGTSGIFLGVNFTIVGRLQLVYENGFWNEWHAVLDDGSSAWLSDAGGQYVITAAAKTQPQLPPFERLTPGGSLQFEGTPYIAADVRTARCTGGQGELPFKAGPGWEARVADFRSGNLFLTLDYSDTTPVAYVGKSVTLESLKCQMLRTADQIAQSAGKLPGSVANLECPSCGASIAYRAGLAQHLICQVCHAEVSPDPQAQGGTDRFSVLAKHEELEARQTTLSLGDKAQIQNVTWTLIGVLERSEVGEDDSTWIEYLLHNPDKGLKWLVETSEGWDLVEVLDEWPGTTAGDGVKLRGLQYRKTFTYDAEVTWAAGAFNWRVHVGDRVTITDYKAGDQSLSAERDTQELTWSLAKRVQTQAVLRWFGKQADAAPRQALSNRQASREVDTRTWCRNAAVYATLGLGAVNAPALFMDNTNLIWPILGIVALWYPLFKFSDQLEDDD
ncbi:DUF4178 domain-containing protein [Viridibacterium curvum]|uniref:C2H2-type domain-containing protein n=1 Tax=Viridibacterium curvum TaxID=1101404 RepID=A0ABP9QQK8_9RHOO